MCAPSRPNRLPFLTRPVLRGSDPEAWQTHGVASPECSPPSSSRAKASLTAALKASLPPSVADRFVGATHTRRFADNLVAGLTQAQIATLQAQLAGGAGGELTPTKNGKRPANAPYSSAALAANAFGRWLGFEEQLSIAGLAGFSAPLEVESRQRIAHGGGTANLDVLLGSPGRIVGVESKLTETLSEHKPVEWRAPYAAPPMLELLDGGWADVFAASRAGEWQPRHLGLEQLVKHALALASQFSDSERHLVYVW